MFFTKLTSTVCEFVLSLVSKKCSLMYNACVVITKGKRDEGKKREGGLDKFCPLIREAY